MKVLVVGSGGREHALCRALAGSPRVAEVLCAPGSDAIGLEARCVGVGVDDLEGLVGLARDERVGLVVPGPEAPLVAGLADRLVAAGVPVFGPSAAAARLEGSKAFMKRFCARHGLPTAPFRVFASSEAVAARAHVEAHGAPIVIKADGLAAGKGVTVAATTEQALAALEQAFGGAFGEAGKTVVVEDVLAGEEASLFALVDGQGFLPFGTAQDHKRVGEGDSGPNTGGMGAYSPAPVMTEAMMERACDEIVAPAVAGLRAEGMPYRGFLYAGLMITPAGPQLLEFNVRLGDPEAQGLLPRLVSDLAELCLAGANGALAGMDVRWSPEPALTVVLAANGYPGAYQKGTEISGLEAAAAEPGVTIFHAGTRIEGGRVLAQGGRVLNVTGLGPTLKDAYDRAYAAVGRINWAGGFCRRDIGWRALQRAG